MIFSKIRKNEVLKIIFYDIRTFFCYEKLRKILVLMYHKSHTS